MPFIILVVVRLLPIGDSEDVTDEVIGSINIVRFFLRIELQQRNNDTKQKLLAASIE